MVRTNPLVGVTLNYRLGALGFLALPSPAGGGDLGFEDEKAALGWIKRNIAAFGGDPNNITIGGESAGGWSVCGHLVAPGSRGLSTGRSFRAAVRQQACGASRPRASIRQETGLRPGHVDGVLLARKAGRGSAERASAI